MRRLITCSYSVFLMAMLVSSLEQTYSKRVASKQKDKSSNRKYSKWNSWTPCPSMCRFDCYSHCVQLRYKTCIKSEICQSNVLKDEKTCGRCESSLPSSYPMTSPAPTPTSRLLIKTPDSGRQLVKLVNHCLPDYHFSTWGDWSKCLNVCRKVRYRQCLTTLCLNRVAHMEDLAVKQEEWCIPEVQEGESQELVNCQKYLSHMALDGGQRLPSMELRQCESTRRKLAAQRLEEKTSSEKPTETLPEGSVLELGVSCGLRNMPSRSLRIIGGKTVKKGHWPWQVAIMIDKKKNDFTDFPHHQNLFNSQQFYNYTEAPSYVQYCGGTLINNQWVLTAAHCVKQRETGLRKPNMVVMVGETDMRVMKEEDDSWHTKIYKISKVIDHNRFEWESVNNDIALLKLEKPVPNAPEIGFSCVPKEDMEVSAGTECIAVGWGKSKKYPKQRSSKRLKEAILPLVSRQECKSAFNFTITKNQMCAGYKDGRSDSCDGDSGGPLLCLAKTSSGERWIVYGITSFGSNDGCGIAGRYGVYTKVNNYSDWIEYAIETGTQTPEPATSTENRRRRHKKQKRKREKYSQRDIESTTKSNHLDELEMIKSLLVDSGTNLQSQNRTQTGAEN